MSDLHPDNLPSPNTLPPLAGSALVIRGQFAHTLGGSNFDSGPSDLVSTLDLTSAIPAGTGSQAYFTSSRPVPLRVADALVAFSPRGRIRLAGGSTHNSSNRWEPNVRGLFEYDADRDDWATLVPAAAPEASPSSDSPAPGAQLPLQALLPIGCSVPTTLFASTGSTVGRVVYAFGGKVDATGTNPTYVDELKRVSMLDRSVVVEVIDKPPSGGGGGGGWPQARASALMLPVNDTHLLLSGGVGEGGKALKDWWVFEIGKGVWTKGPSELTAPRYSHRGVVYDERHVIQTGGWLDSSAAPFLESIDLFTGSVTPIPAQLAPGESDELLMAKHLARHNMVLAGDQLLMYGGYAEFNDSLPVFRHNRRLYVASLSYTSPGGALAAHWQSAYRPTLLLPPNYLRNGRPGDHAPWYAVMIVLVSIVTSTAALASVRSRWIGARHHGPAGAWWMWWRKVSESIGRKTRWREQGAGVTRTSLSSRDLMDDSRKSHDAGQDDTEYLDACTDHAHEAATPFSSLTRSPDSPATLVDPATIGDTDAWPERNQSRRGGGPATYLVSHPRLSIFTTASSSPTSLAHAPPSILPPKTPPARTPPTRPSSSSFGQAGSTTLASSSTGAGGGPGGQASKPTVSVLPTPSMVRRGVGERVISVPEVLDPLPMPIPVSPAVVAAGAGTATDSLEQNVAEGLVRELHVRPVVVSGSLGSSVGGSGERARGTGYSGMMQAPETR